MFFVDTSALAKRYLEEVGSSWVQGWIVPAAGNTIVVSEIVVAEMWSLLARRVREGFSRQTADGARVAFSLHVRREYRVVGVNRRGLLLAGRLAERHALRTLDAIHLAAAFQALSNLNTSITFVSADKNQRAAALAEGFFVDDPNAHP